MLEDLSKAIVLLERMNNSIDLSYLDDYYEAIELLYKVQDNVKTLCKNKEGKEWQHHLLIKISP